MDAVAAGRVGGSLRATGVVLVMMTGLKARRHWVQGARLYDWALIGAHSPQHYLLVRRPLTPGEKGELELGVLPVLVARPVTLPELAAVAGANQPSL